MRKRGFRRIRLRPFVLPFRGRARRAVEAQIDQLIEELETDIREVVADGEAASPAELQAKFLALATPSLADPRAVIHAVDGLEGVKDVVRELTALLGRRP